MRMCASTQRSGNLPEVDDADSVKGPKVAILGASGGVGTFAVQIAKKHFGAFVLACCSGKHKALVQKLGADRVVDYTQEGWKEECKEFKNFDLVVDCVGLDAYWETFGRGVLGSHGRYITLNTLQAELPQCADEGKKTKKSAGKAAQPKATPADTSLFDKDLERQATERLLAAKSRMLNINSFFSGFRLFAADKDVQDDELETVADLIQDGAVEVVVDSVHELRDVEKAYLLVEGMHAAGKVVVRLRRPWERESVQNFRLAPDEAQEHPQDAVSGSPTPTSPSAQVPLCSLGPEVVDKESITKKLTAAKSLRKPRTGLQNYPGVSEEDTAGPPLVPGLPAGWEFAYDDEGTIYYYSHALGISQYEHPATGKLERAAASGPHKAAAAAANTPIRAVTEAQFVAARGSRSSGFMDDLAAPQPQPASLGLPLPVGDFSDDDDVQAPTGKSALPTVGEDEEVDSFTDEFDPENGMVPQNSAAAAHTSRGKVRGGREVGPLAGKMAEEIRAKGVLTGTPPLCGLGVTLKLSSGGEYYIKRMERGGPAERSKSIKAGDKLLAVDRKQVTGVEYNHLAQLVLGPEGSEVTLTLKREDSGELHAVTLRRFPMDPKVLEDNQRQLKLKQAQLAASQLAAAEESVKQQQQQAEAASAKAAAAAAAAAAQKAEQDRMRQTQELDAKAERALEWQRAVDEEQKRLVREQVVYSLSLSLSLSHTHTIYIYIHTYVHMYTHTHIHIHIHIRMYVCMCVCIYICIIRTYMTHIHTHYVLTDPPIPSSPSHELTKSQSKDFIILRPNFLLLHKRANPRPPPCNDLIIFFL